MDPETETILDGNHLRQEPTETGTTWDGYPEIGTLFRDGPAFQFTEN